MYDWRIFKINWNSCFCFCFLWFNYVVLMLHDILFYLHNSLIISSKSWLKASLKSWGNIVDNILLLKNINSWIECCVNTLIMGMNSDKCLSYQFSKQSLSLIFHGLFFFANTLKLGTNLTLHLLQMYVSKTLFWWPRQRHKFNHKLLSQR